MDQTSALIRQIVPKAVDRIIGKKQDRIKKSCGKCFMKHDHNAHSNKINIQFSTLAQEIRQA
jgi:hypothetical protein